MKKLSLASLLTLSSVLFLQAQSTPKAEQIPKEGPQIAFDTTEYDFGKIKAGDKVTRVFEFENEGTEPLLLLGVQTSCGCTAPSWPKDPIMPGEKGEVQIIFNSTGKSGSQNKRVTVSSNANNNSSLDLYLRGEVEKK